MPRELIVDAEWLGAILRRFSTQIFDYCDCNGVREVCDQHSRCTDCLIAHSNGKVREFEKPDLTSVLTKLEYAAFNLCESASEISIRGIIDSTCPEISLLIAIRELKEIQKREPNHE